MSTEPLDLLLEKLSAGDGPAAEQVFWAYEPYLRLVVRRHLPGRLRAKFDSLDVVQSVWVHVLPGFREARWRFATTAQLRAFLIRVARRRLSNRARHYRAALEHEQPLHGNNSEVPLSCGEPRPSEVVQADELWQQMLALCPPAYHELLRLRRQGLLLEEIAARTGLHEGSVRRILRQLARDLAFSPDGAPPNG
jgi:RNA polymerase sigma-70 factor (ECF subfamily)